MTKTKALFEGYWLGMLTMILVSLLQQDFLGMEKYLDMVRHRWINLPWWPWVCGLLVTWAILFRRLREAKKP